MLLKFKGGTNFILCRTSISNTSVENWYNNGFSPSVLESSNPQLGLSNVQVFAMDGMLVCLFTRMNIMNTSKYYSIANDSLPYIISAFGSGKAKL